MIPTPIPSDAAASIELIGAPPESMPVYHSTSYVTNARNTAASGATANPASSLTAVREDGRCASTIELKRFMFALSAPARG